MVPMRYRLLGHSGLRVSEFGLGTMTFGEEWGSGSTRPEAQRIYEIYRSAGGNFLDTSDFYTNGTSERLLKDFIGVDRDAMVLSTKYGYAVPSLDPNAAGTHRKHIVRAVEGSLKRLDTDRIDLFWVNGWDFMTPDVEVMRALDDLVRAGKILYAGIANTPAWVVSRCNTLAELHGWTQFAALQTAYSLVERTPERDLMPMARTLDLGVTACSPLGEGLLSGKYSKGCKGGGRLDNASFTELNDRAFRIVAVVKEMAKEIGILPVQVALAWVRDRGVIPLVAARTAEQMTQNLGTLELALAADQMRRLDEVSAIDLGCPHDYNVKTRRATFGGMFERIERHRERGIGVTTR